VVLGPFADVVGQKREVAVFVDRPDLAAPWPGQHEEDVGGVAEASDVQDAGQLPVGDVVPVLVAVRVVVARDHLRDGAVEVELIGRVLDTVPRRASGLAPGERPHPLAGSGCTVTDLEQEVPVAVRQLDAERRLEGRDRRPARRRPEGPVVERERVVGAAVVAPGPGPCEQGPDGVDVPPAARVPLHGRTLRRERARCLEAGQTIR
jgi:hypothetical protein